MVVAAGGCGLTVYAVGRLVRAQDLAGARRLQGTDRRERLRSERTQVVAVLVLRLLMHRVRLDHVLVGGVGVAVMVPLG